MGFNSVFKGLRHLCEPLCWDARCRAEERHLYWASPAVCFGSTSEAYSAFYNKHLTLLWSPGAVNSWISATLRPSAWRKQITARTSQLAGAAMIVSHVLSVFTPTVCSENVWGYMYSKNRSYLLLLSVCFDAMTMRLFLPTNQSGVDFGIAYVLH